MAADPKDTQSKQKTAESFFDAFRKKLNLACKEKKSEKELSEIFVGLLNELLLIENLERYLLFFNTSASGKKEPSFENFFVDKEAEIEDFEKVKKIKINDKFHFERQGENIVIINEVRDFNWKIKIIEGETLDQYKVKQVVGFQHSDFSPDVFSRLDKRPKLEREAKHSDDYLFLKMLFENFIEAISSTLDQFPYSFSPYYRWYQDHHKRQLPQVDESKDNKSLGFSEAGKAALKGEVTATSAKLSPSATKPESDPVFKKAAKNTS